MIDKTLVDKWLVVVHGSNKAFNSEGPQAQLLTRLIPGRTILRCSTPCMRFSVLYVTCLGTLLERGPSSMLAGRARLAGPELCSTGLIWAQLIRVGNFIITR